MKLPRIYAHNSVLNNGLMFVTNQTILKRQTDSTVNLINRYCPHRGYPIGNIGEQLPTLTCNFHGLSWDKECNPNNHHYNLITNRTANILSCGLIVENLKIDENLSWVKDLEQLSNLHYSHSVTGVSMGSWLWMMDIQADLLHIRDSENSIHPELGSVTNLDEIEMYEGENWILQTCSTGWWLFIFPWTFIEYSPGCLSINFTVPNQLNEEFGFSWMTQFYYSPEVNSDKKTEFETLDHVFRQDVAAVEKQKIPYWPLITPLNKYENHSVYFGKWVKNNLFFVK